MDVNDMIRLLDDRVRIAKVLFGVDAVLGILAIGGAALYGAALTSGNPWVAFFGMLLPLSALWLLLCYVAYQGLTTGHGVAKIVFWLYVTGNFFAFPTGTAISGLSIWLWRELRKTPRSDDPTESS